MNTYSNRNIDRYNRAALSSIDTLFGDISVDAISEPLLSVCDTETIGHAASIMQERRFDVLGVTHAGRVMGYLSNVWNELPLDPSSARPVTGLVQGFGESAVTSSCSLWDGLNKLARLPRLFVTEGGSSRGMRIVTRADLQKAPVRMMVFAYITVYEIHLTERIRQYYPGDSWEHALAPAVAASETEKDDFCRRKAWGEEVDLLDCLGFLRKEQIIVATGQLISECTPANCDPSVLLPKVRSLRNAVAHGSSLANRQRRWADVYQILRVVRTLNARLEAGDGQAALAMPEEMSAENA